MKNAHTGLLAAFLHDKKSEKNIFWFNLQFFPRFASFSFNSNYLKQKGKCYIAFYNHTFNNCKYYIAVVSYDTRTTMNM
jgi:hypothetical protein